MMMIIMTMMSRLASGGSLALMTDSFVPVALQP
jgi:hypothetical protein